MATKTKAREDVITGLTKDNALELAWRVEVLAIEARDLDWANEEDILRGHFETLAASARAILKAKDQIDRINGPRERERAEA